MIRNHFIIFTLLLTIHLVCFGENTTRTKVQDSLCVEQVDSQTLVIDSTTSGTAVSITKGQEDEKAQLKQVFSLLWPLILHYRWYIAAVAVILIALYNVRKYRKRKKAMRPTFTPSPAQSAPISQP